MKLRKEAVVEKLVGGENLQIWFQSLAIQLKQETWKVLVLHTGVYTGDLESPQKSPKNRRLNRRKNRLCKRAFNHPFSFMLYYYLFGVFS